MKFGHQLLLPVVASAALIQPRAPHDPQAPKTVTPPKSGPGTTFASLVKSKGMAAALKALPVAKLAKVKTLTPKIRPDAKRTLSIYGPYKLAGKNEPKPTDTLTSSMDPNGQAFLELISDGLCKNCTILSGGVGMQKLDGTVAGSDSGLYLHHAASYDTSRPPDLPIWRCKLSDIVLGAEFIAQGDDGLNSYIYYTSRDGKSNTGYHVGTDLKILSQVDVVNSNEKPQEIYVTVDMEYMEGNVGSDAKVTLMSVTGCNRPGMPGYDPTKVIKLDPNGPATTVSEVYPFTRDGRIVSASAHMHIGGEEMVMTINNQPVCVSKAVYAPVEGGGEIIKYNEPCKPNIPFKKGDNFTMTAVYDLKKHPLRHGAEHSVHGGADVMGMFYLTLSGP